MSRLGIEPRTRRLREIGRLSTGVRSIRYPRNSQRFVSGRVHSVYPSPAVRGSDRGSPFISQQENVHRDHDEDEHDASSHAVRGAAKVLRAIVLSSHVPM